MSNIKDVAALAGVSVPTVYKAYSNTYFTSPEIREKVYAAAKELGYVPKTVNRTGGKESKRTVALFLDEIVNHGEGDLQGTGTQGIPACCYV